MKPQRWARIGKPTREWLLVEHPSGKVEDLGFVTVERLMPMLSTGIAYREDPLKYRGRIQWIREGSTRGAVDLVPEDYEEGEPKNPVTVDMPDGDRLLWHFGEAAYRRAKEAGILFSDAPEHMVELPVIEVLAE